MLKAVEKSAIFIALMVSSKVKTFALKDQTRSLDLSRVRWHFQNVRQTDRQTAIYFTKFPFLPFRDTKTLFKALKTVLLLTVGPTDRKVAYGVV